MATPQVNGTILADGTEQTLATVTTAGSYVLHVDLSALADGDTVVLRLKSRVLSGGTDRLAYEASFSHAQGTPLTYSIPVPTAHQIIATLEQTAGTNRSYDWSLLAL